MAFEILKKYYLKSKDTNFEDGKVIAEIIKNHQANLLPYYTRNREYYLGKQAILETNAVNGRPNNQVLSNHVQYVADMEVGYFIGIPIKYQFKADNKPLSDSFEQIRDNNELASIDFEHAENCAMFGHSFELQFIDDSKQYRIKTLSPENVAIVYSDDIEGSRLAAIYYAAKTVENKEVMVGYVYTAEYQYEFKLDGENVTVVPDSKATNDVKRVPVIEFKQNRWRKGCYDQIISLVDAYNKALSQKANDVDYFAEAYLLIAGAKLEDKDSEGNDTLQTLINNRIIHLEEVLEHFQVKFLEKPNADGSQENLLDRTKKDIFTISGVPDMTSEDFSNASGRSIRYRMFVLENSRTKKEMQFRTALRQRFKYMFTYLGKLKDDVLSTSVIDFTFSKNIPANYSDEIEDAKNLSGIVSKKSQLGTLSFIEDVEAEMAQIEAEKGDTSDGINILGKTTENPTPTP